MRRLTNLLMTTTVFLAFSASVLAATSQATEYVVHTPVASGVSYTGPTVALFASNTESYGSAIGCSGISGLGVNCNTYTDPGGYLTTGFVWYYDVWSQPYIHNHSTWTGWFNGFYET